jgi:hypothetical protein
VEINIGKWFQYQQQYHPTKVLLYVNHSTLVYRFVPFSPISIVDLVSPFSSTLSVPSRFYLFFLVCGYHHLLHVSLSILFYPVFLLTILYGAVHCYCLYLYCFCTFQLSLRYYRTDVSVWVHVVLLVSVSVSIHDMWIYPKAQ